MASGGEAEAQGQGAQDRSLARLGRLPATTVSDAMERTGSMDSGIRPAWPGARLCGRALTVLTRPGDNLAIHQALEVAKQDDVLVVNGGGDLSRALVGEIVAAKAQSLGVAGFVVDGVVRDGEGIERLGLPIFARGLNPAGPYRTGPGRVQVPIAIGGIVVNPGDLVVADADGVVVVPAGQAEAVIGRAEELFAAELEQMQKDRA